jgi:acetoin utilization deacetylase AcuC-like enzyme
LDAAEFSDLDRREPPEARLEQIQRVHPASHVSEVLSAIPASGTSEIDGDTVVSEGSREAALRACGALTAAVDAVMAGEGTNAFCAVRPPGHHAEPETSMGFCLFNNVAVGAMQAREVHGLKRIAVVDFDVHHGNGTQAFFADNAELFYASTHQSPLYPGTGARSEVGVGNIANAPLPPGAGSSEFRAAFTSEILLALRRFGPDFLFISAGFDAHAEDPLANLNLEADDYAWATRELLAVAADACQGRVVSALEGGYSLSALAESCSAHVRALMKA